MNFRLLSKIIGLLLLFLGLTQATVWVMRIDLTLGMINSIR